jgi:hypothetical protein
MAAGPTYTSLATTTTSGSAASYTFSSISGVYTDLIIVVSGGASVAIDLSLRFNGDTGSNYSFTRLTLDNLTAVSARTSNATSLRISDGGFVTTTLGASNQTINIMNYANTTTYKTLIARCNRAAGGIDATFGLWRSTSAITSIELFPGTSTFLDGTTLTLYGIAAA